MAKTEELLYLFTGNAQVFINNRINLILNALTPKTYDLQKYDLEQTSIKTIIEDCLTPPFLEDYKVIIVKNLSILTNKNALPIEYKILYNYFKNPNPTTILIFEASNIQIVKSNELYKELCKYAMMIDYSNQESIEISAWIKMCFNQEEINITPDAIEKLIEYTSNDQIRIMNEINKLICFAKETKQVDELMITELVNKDLSNEIFVLIKAIINKDKNKIFNILQELTKQTKDIQGIIALITHELNNLYTISKLLKRGYNQSDIAKFLNISTGRAYYLIKDVQTLSINNLNAAIINLADLDYQIKTGQIDKKIGLELLLLKL